MHVAASGVDELEVVRHTTPVMRGGHLVEGVLAALTGLVLVAGLVAPRLRRPDATMGDAPAPGGGEEG